MLHTPQEIANARRNVDRFAWARAELGAVLERCRPWIERTDEELWSWITGQAVPRGIHVNSDLGCPRCGREVYRYGNYPWKIQPDRPWKLECPSCGEVWPKNDFAAFHRSGLGPGGVFRRDLADESLLFNTEHPNAGDPLHRYAVDDGMGWLDDTGARWWFVAYYAHYGTWTWLPDAAADMATVYEWTGRAEYAHKALVILDRVADLYPSMDLMPYSRLQLYNSHGGTGKGRVWGCIWETFLAEKLARAWDMVREAVHADGDLVAFLSSQAARWNLANDKSTPARIIRNVEDGLLRELILSCRDGRIEGNEGMTQTAMAVAAAVLDDPEETPAALDWLFEPGTRRSGGGHIPKTLVEEVDRDGVGNEASPGYSFIWMKLFLRCAEVLERCRAHRDYDLFRDYPKLRRMLAAPYKLTVLDRYTPHIGDTGKTGDPGMISMELPTVLEALRRLRDPYFAGLALLLNGSSVEGLHTSIYDAEPESIREQIRAAVAQEGTVHLRSANLDGYGLAMFRRGAGEDRRAAWMYYGRSTGHGHRDRLNYGMYYRGMDVLPDLGYPEYADGKWPSRAGWTSNTASHNTLVVDAKAQVQDRTGHCLLFAEGHGVGVTEVASPAVYPGLNDYRRTLAVLDLDDRESYLVDFFRVDGGTDHVLSFHAGEGDAVETGGTWEQQDRGTFAGEDVAFGLHYDGPPDGRYGGSGFSYLYGVSRAERPEPGFRVDWNLKDTWSTRIGIQDVHVRLHALSRVDEAATAWGDPPQNKPGNPRRLRYLLLRRRSSRSLFASVVEPYSGDRPRCARVECIDLGLPDGDLTAAAVLVVSVDGGTDRILSSDDPERLFAMGDGVAAAARFAAIRFHGDGTVSLVLVGGRRVRWAEGELDVEGREYGGKVLDFHRLPDGPAWIDTDADLPLGKRLGNAQIRVHNDGLRDACYVIQSVSQRPDGRRRIELGDTTFVRGLGEDGELLFDLGEGDAFDVQNVVEVRIGDGKAREVRATARWEYRRVPTPPTAGAPGRAPGRPRPS